MKENLQLKVGDQISYSRHADKTKVTGTIRQIFVRTDSSGLFQARQLQDEQVAYALDLSEEDVKRIGHPVTVGASRCALIEGERKDG